MANPAEDGHGKKIVVCIRCPQKFTQWPGRRANTLCRDCRDTMTAEMQEAWAA